MIFWITATGGSLFLDARALAFWVGFGSGMVFPLGLIIDRLRGLTVRTSNTNPVTQIS
jgi:hypothetical protein